MAHIGGPYPLAQYQQCYESGVIIAGHFLGIFPINFCLCPVNTALESIVWWLIGSAGVLTIVLSYGPCE